MRERDRRVTHLADELISACIPKSAIDRDICKFIASDHELFIDLVTVLDCIKLRLEKLTRKQLKTAAGEMTPPPPDKSDKDSGVFKFARYFAATSSREAYNKMREQYTQSQDLPLHYFPSHHQIMKGSRPEIVPINLAKEDDDESVNFSESGLEVDINDTVGVPEGVLQLKDKVTVKTFVSKQDVTMKDALEEIKLSKNAEKKEDIFTARIKGNFTNYIDMMTKKFTNTDIVLGDQRIIIDSYDGAEHSKTTKRKVGIISFNSQLLSTSSISVCSPASSINILTWQQLVGEEKFSTLYPALKKTFESKALIRDRERLEVYKGKKHFMYELHDGKKLYLLTQHLLLNRKHHPFLLCACQRGQGVKDRNHKCTIISNERQQYYYDRSLKRWNRQTKNGSDTSKYNVDTHKD